MTSRRGSNWILILTPGPGSLMVSGIPYHCPPPCRTPSVVAQHWPEEVESFVVHFGHHFDTAAWTMACQPQLQPYPWLAPFPLPFKRLPVAVLRNR